MRENHFFRSQRIVSGTFLVIEWFRLRASTAEGMGSYPVRKLRLHMMHSIATRTEILSSCSLKEKKFTS